jgi:hypothetical protein
MIRLLLILLIPATLWAEYEDIEPTGVGTYDSWINVGGATKVASVTDDVDNNYIYCTSSKDHYQDFNLSDPGDIEAGDTIDSVVTYWRGRKSGIGPAAAICNQVYGASKNTGYEPTLTTSWTDFTEAFTTAPGGGSWTLAIVNALVVQMDATERDATNYPQSTKIYLRLFYTPAAGGNISYVRRKKMEDD